MPNCRNSLVNTHSTWHWGLQSTMGLVSSNRQKYQECMVSVDKYKIGDHLYNKGDFENSINHYLKTTGYIETSYVNRKFL